MSSLCFKANNSKRQKQDIPLVIRNREGWHSITSKKLPALS